jgi:hypothetical protein
MEYLLSRRDLHARDRPVHRILVLREVSECNGPNLEGFKESYQVDRNAFGKEMGNMRQHSVPEGPEAWGP